MHWHRQGLSRAQQEQWEVTHPMNFAKIARLVNPVPKEPPSANHVAKESSVTKMAPPAKSAKKELFKIKTQYQVPFARRVQLDTTTTRPEKVRVKTLGIRSHPIAPNYNTSTTSPLTQKIGHALDAPLVLPALETSIGTGSKPNLDGQDATITMLPLRVVFFQRLAWVAPTRP